jgi:hypothetical protein
LYPEYPGLPAHGGALGTAEGFGIDHTGIFHQLFAFGDWP